MSPPMGLHGQGTVARVPQPDGTTRYKIAVTMADGHRVWRRARTPRDAERIRKQLVEMRELELDPTRQTLGDFLRSWIASLRDARNARVRPRTLDHYTLIVERHIIPALGSLSLSRVTGRRIQAWLDDDTGSPRTVRHHHAVLRRALNVAVRQRLLAYNPASSVELPDVPASRADPLTLDEARALMTATADDRLGVLWRLAIVSGLRQGELLGLARDDVDGDRVTVTAQLQRLGRSWVRTPPKAARRLATIRVDAGTAAALEAHKRRQAAERQADWPYWGLLFVTPDGRPLHGTDVLRAFHEASDRAGIRRRRFHDLRHTSAHLLADAGVPQDTRKARLGHSTDRMAELYSGASEVQDGLAAEALGRALGGAG